MVKAILIGLALLSVSYGGYLKWTGEPVMYKRCPNCPPWGMVTNCPERPLEPCEWMVLSPLRDKKLEATFEDLRTRAGNGDCDGSEWQALRPTPCKAQACASLRQNGWRLAH